jgi:hypothetical protein
MNRAAASWIAGSMAHLTQQRHADRARVPLLKLVIR